MNPSLTKERIHTTEEALIFLTGATLSTLIALSAKSRVPLGELSRQVSIAQVGIDHLRGIVRPGEWCGNQHVQDIFDDGLTAQEWIDEKRKNWTV